MWLSIFPEAGRTVPLGPSAPEPLALGPLALESLAPGALGERLARLLKLLRINATTHIVSILSYTFKYE